MNVYEIDSILRLFKAAEQETIETKTDPAECRRQLLELLTKKIELLNEFEVSGDRQALYEDLKLSLQKSLDEITKRS